MGSVNFDRQFNNELLDWIGDDLGEQRETPDLVQQAINSEDNAMVGDDEQTTAVCNLMREEMTPPSGVSPIYNKSLPPRQGPVSLYYVNHDQSNNDEFSEKNQLSESNEQRNSSGLGPYHDK